MYAKLGVCLCYALVVFIALLYLFAGERRRDSLDLDCAVLKRSINLFYLLVFFKT